MRPSEKGGNPIKYWIKTFGCQMNFADSDEMARHFKDRGVGLAGQEEQATIIMVNTCTVRDLAEHKGMSYLGRLKEWKQRHPNGLVVVTGCAAERAKTDIYRRFPYVDLVVGAKDIEKFPDELDALLKTQVPTLPLALAEERLIPEALAAEAGPVIQYVTIMRGCNYQCTYCIVPAVRGREIYRPADQVVSDVKARVAEGAREVWLLGQTVNSYRPANARFEGYDFADLLRDVSAVPGLARLRFISPHPFYLTPKLTQAMAECAPVCEHMHLPVQSGSNDVLRRMRRNYSREAYLEGIRQMREKIPTISLTTDLIVGFPGETEGDFEQTLSLVKEAQFDSAYCFQYSPRPGTSAAEWPDDVPDSVKEDRVNRLLSLTDGVGVAKAAAQIGSLQEVLVEDDKGAGLFRGKTRGSWRVRFHSPTAKIGDLLNVKITGSHSRELHAEVV